MTRLSEVEAFLLWHLQLSPLAVTALAALKLTGVMSFKAKWVMLPLLDALWLLVSFWLARCIAQMVFGLRKR